MGRIRAGTRRRPAVTEVEIAGGTLIDHVRDMHKLWALRSRLEIPLAQVSDAEESSETAHGGAKGFKLPGTYIPGVIPASTFYHEGDRVFWGVHDPEKAVVVRLTGERYARLVIEVADPVATTATVQSMIGER